jgi:hypothetical protein
MLRFLRKYIGRTQVLEEILATHEVQVLKYGLETKQRKSTVENSRYCKAHVSISTKSKSQKPSCPAFLI